MPVGEGASLGIASGRIIVDTSDLRSVEARTRQVGQNVERSLGRINTGAARAQRGIGSLAAAFGVAAGAIAATELVLNRVASATQFFREQTSLSVRSASDLTESINKIGVAFAESQGQVLRWSEGSARALGQSQQQALEAASSFGLLFRTMGIAPTETAQMSQALVELAADLASINNIEPELALEKLRAGLVGEIEPLRSVGVLLDEASTKAKAMELGLAGNANALTQQDKVLARYQLILEQTALAQGDFARTSGEAANQQRILTAEVQDFRTELGKTILPGYILLLRGATTAMHSLNRAADEGTAIVERYARAWTVISTVVGAMAGGAGFGAAVARIPLRAGALADIGVSDQLMISRGRRMAPAVNQGRITGELEAGRDRSAALRELTRDTGRARIDATEQFEEQRTETIRSYERTIAREAEDFSRQRARAEEEFQRSIVDIREDAARREADAAEDLARATTRARADTDERIADLREDTNERLLEVEEDYQRDRVRAERQHRDNLLSAASRLDARAVAEEQRRFRREQEDAAEAHDEQRSDLQEALSERIAEEEEALEKSNRLRQEAYDRQIREQREADERRIQDMREDFERRKQMEDEDRRIRLSRMVQDHNDQLAEMGRQHQLRLEQIARHAREEREIINEAFREALIALGSDLSRWKEALERIFPPLPSTGGAARGLPEMMPAFQSGGPVNRTGPAILHAGEFVLSRQMLAAVGGPGGMTVNIAVNGAGSDGNGIALAIRREMENLFRSLA